MTTAVSAFLLLLLAMIVVASYLLVLAPDSPVHTGFNRQVDDLLDTVPEARTRTAIQRLATTAADTATAILSAHAPARAPQARPPIMISVIRGTLALSVLPVLGTLAMIGSLLGLLRRRLLIENLGFHSVTFSYLGKTLAAFSAAAYAFSGLSPLGPPLWTLYVFAATAALGTALYFGNLPPKL